MNKITFNNVLPQVFATMTGTVTSDIWQQKVSFERGRYYLIEAESGKGKSTFCSYILGYRHDYSGEIMLDGVNAQSYDIPKWSRLRQQHVSCLFQELRLFPELTAYENVEIKNKLTKFRSRQQIADWFEMLGIADKFDEPVGRMSFGQQQRVALMRALVQPFDFLLADEPISHLDDDNAKIMAQLLRQEADSQGASIIVTSIGKRLPLNYDYTFQL
ncbi:MAG: ATP-binding cassette domain-containing protein [Prevotella sp.]|nr:ATP-binding cassette domain-containing protein [Prevotella sp.]